MQVSAGWKFVARVAALQMAVHIGAAAGFIVFLETSVIRFEDAFHSLLGFWLTGPLPLVALLPLGIAVPRTSIYERALAAGATGEACPEPEASAAKRQLLGQATYSAAMALLQWLFNIVACLAMLRWQNHEAPERLLSALLAGVGVFTPLVAIAIWLVTERAIRPYFPLLFPDGRVSDIARRRQSIDSRLLIAFVLSGPVASGLMAAIAYIKSVDILTNPAQGYFHLQAMIGMMFLALGGTFVVALVFKQLLSSDTLGGIGRVSRALERLADGEYDVQVPVVGNDEVGRLAERTNALARALRRANAPSEADVQAIAASAQVGELAVAERTFAPPLS